MRPMIHHLQPLTCIQEYSDVSTSFIMSTHQRHAFKYGTVCGKKASIFYIQALFICKVGELVKHKFQTQQFILLLKLPPNRYPDIDTPCEIRLCFIP